MKKSEHGVLLRGARTVLILAATTALLGFSAVPAAAAQSGNDALHIEQLESALAPKDARQAAEYWAQSLAQRNGALRFALLSDSLRMKYGQDYANGNWVIGCSSPWVDSYQVVYCGDNGKGATDYEIDYTLTDSTAAAYHASETVSVQLLDRNTSSDKKGTGQSRWCVTAGNDLDAMDFPLK